MICEHFHPFSTRQGFSAAIPKCKGQPKALQCEINRYWGLIAALLSDGKHLIEGKKDTGFAYLGKTIAGVKRLVPYNLEKRFKDNGLIYSKAPVPLMAHTVLDGKSIAGQNPNAATESACKTLEAIGVLTPE